MERLAGGSWPLGEPRSPQPRSGGCRLLGPSGGPDTRPAQRQWPKRDPPRLASRPGPPGSSVRFTVRPSTDARVSPSWQPHGQGVWPSRRTTSPVSKRTSDLQGLSKVVTKIRPNLGPSVLRGKGKEIDVTGLCHLVHPPGLALHEYVPRLGRAIGTGDRRVKGQADLAPVQDRRTLVGQGDEGR